jgi:hypothetical protein
MLQRSHTLFCTLYVMNVSRKVHAYSAQQVKYCRALAVLCFRSTHWSGEHTTPCSVNEKVNTLQSVQCTRGIYRTAEYSAAIIPSATMNVTTAEYLYLMYVAIAEYLYLMNVPRAAYLYLMNSDRA